MKAEHPLSRWRKVHGITQQTLATATGLTQGMIAHIENYRHIPARESLERLRVYTGLPTDALVRGEQFLSEQPDFPYSQHVPNPVQADVAEAVPGTPRQRKPRAPKPPDAIE